MCRMLSTWIHTSGLCTVLVSAAENVPSAFTSVSDGSATADEGDGSLKSMVVVAVKAVVVQGDLVRQA